MSTKTRCSATLAGDDDVPTPVDRRNSASHVMAGQNARRGWPADDPGDACCRASVRGPAIPWAESVVMLAATSGALHVAARLTFVGPVTRLLPWGALRRYGDGGAGVPEARCTEPGGDDEESARGGPQR